MNISQPDYFISIEDRVKYYTQNLNQYWEIDFDKNTETVYFLNTENNKSCTYHDQSDP